MPLLKPEQVRSFEAAEPAGPAPVAAHGVSGAATCIVGKRGVDLEQLIPALQQDHSYRIPSRGSWSLHEMLEFLLGRIGPAEVWLTSWGITQDPLRRVLDLLQRGTITQLHALFDSRVKLQCPEAYQLTLSGTAEVRLAKNHSKMLVLINVGWGITVSTSANLTANERLEHYVIDTHRSAAAFDRDWISLELAGAHPFQEE